MIENHNTNKIIKNQVIQHGYIKFDNKRSSLIEWVSYELKY